jgi:hypothetical protein
MPWMMRPSYNARWNEGDCFSRGKSYHRTATGNPKLLLKKCVIPNARVLSSERRDLAWSASALFSRVAGVIPNKKPSRKLRRVCEMFKGSRLAMSDRVRPESVSRADHVRCLEAFGAL